MISTPRTLLAALLLTGAFAAGCGGDDNEESGSDAPAVTAETPTVDSETLTTDAPPEEEDTGGAAVPENVDEAIQQCKDGVEASPQLSDDVKEDLVQLCEDAASRSPEELADIARETCEKVVEGTLPPGDARDQAMASCESAGN